eukprot:6671933-Prymnesium_polylepis.1
MPSAVVATRAPTDRFDRRVTTATRSRSPLRLGGVRSTAARSAAFRIKFSPGRVMDVGRCECPHC